MKSEDLFENKEEVKKYVKAIKDSLKNRQMIMNSLATRK
jgi:hypothetical protein